MNETLALYLIAWLIPLLLGGAYFLVRFLLRGEEKKLARFKKIFVYTSAAIMGLSLFVAYYLMPDAMRPYALRGTAGLSGFRAGIGCFELVGVPYRDNKVANFFAWFQSYLYLPAIFMVFLFAFYNFKTGRLLSKFVLLPVSVLHAAFVFNLVNAYTGSTALKAPAILYAISAGFMVTLAAIGFYENRKEKFEGRRSVARFIFFLVIPLMCCVPTYTVAQFVPASSQLFGMPISTYRIYDFTELHRIFIYMTFLTPFVLYFLFRGEEEDGRRAIVILISLAALFQFMTDYNFESTFYVTGDGTRKINVTMLPIHLCHTALYVVPLCVAFKWKRLFYFTYYINVFGALMAMLAPNVGEDTLILLPDIFLFWSNHITALMMPILCVALHLFERAKFRQMMYSLSYFAAYFVIILFLNAWLSNYVPGYNPDKLGTGTDFLFINDTYVLDLFGKEAYHMMDVRIRFEAGGMVFVIYPLYQAVFFVGYVAIAFAMWFVYSLFFRIADAHFEVHAKATIARLEHLETLRYRKEFGYMDPNATPVLEFNDFAKKYGNSDHFAVDHVHLKVTGGQIFGFLGPNGAGKSTCIKSAIGIQPITEGKISVCGFDVKTESTACKKLIGYVPDHYALYEKLSGREYINYIADLYGVSKEERDERINHYVEIFDLQQAFDNRMATYSHGMKQKMTIIAALVHNPKVWILDEPLTGLDPQSIFQVKQAMIAHAKAGNIVFFSSHIIDVVEKLCTDIAIIKKGHIIYEGKLDETLKEHPEGLENFYMKQINEVVEKA